MYLYLIPLKVLVHVIKLIINNVVLPTNVDIKKLEHHKIRNLLDIHLFSAIHVIS